MAKDLEMSVLLDFYSEMLTEKQREVVGFYYNEDLSLSEIAEHSGITRQGVRDCIKRAEHQLTDCEDRLGLAKRFRQIQSGLDEIVRLAGQLEQEQIPGIYAQRVEQYAQDIRDVAERISSVS